MKKCAVCKQLKETKLYEVEAKTSGGESAIVKIHLCQDCKDGYNKKFISHVIIP